MNREKGNCKNTEKKRRKPSLNHRIQLGIASCIPNMTLLSYTIAEATLTKKCYGIMEIKMDGGNDGCKDGRNDRQM